MPDERQAARLNALKARFGKKIVNSQIGGKGSMRRKKQYVRKKETQDDKRLQGALKRLNVNNIPAIEEVNLFRKGDDTVIHFSKPNVQASIAANTYVVSGNCETKKVMEMIPGILSQLGPDNLENLKDMANEIQKLSAQSGVGGLNGEDDDDEVPELVENVNFEDIAAEEAVKGGDDLENANEIMNLSAQNDIAGVNDEDDDDEVPELVENVNFEDIAAEEAVKSGDDLENANEIKKLSAQNDVGGLNDEDDDDEVPELVENVNFEDIVAEDAVNVGDENNDNNDDDIPDLVETTNFNDHIPVAISTEPNTVDNADAGAKVE